MMIKKKHFDFKKRLCYGFTPWRKRPGRTDVMISFNKTISSKQWRSPEDWLRIIEWYLCKDRLPVDIGGNFDQWDMEVHGGLLGSSRLMMEIEEQGAGKQYVYFRSRPKLSLTGIVLAIFFAVLTFLSASDKSWTITFIISVLTISLVFRMLIECAYASTALFHALKEEKRRVD